MWNQEYAWGTPRRNRGTYPRTAASVKKEIQETAQIPMMERNSLPRFSSFSLPDRFRDTVRPAFCFSSSNASQNAAYARNRTAQVRGSQSVCSFDSFMQESPSPPTKQRENSALRRTGSPGPRMSRRNSTAAAKSRHSPEGIYRDILENSTAAA